MFNKMENIILWVTIGLLAVNNLCLYFIVQREIKRWRLMVHIVEALISRLADPNERKGP